MMVEIRLINSGKYLLRRDIQHLSGVLEIYYLDLNGGYIYMCTCGYIIYKYMVIFICVCVFVFICTYMYIYIYWYVNLRSVHFIYIVFQEKQNENLNHIVCFDVRLWRKTAVNNTYGGITYSYRNRWWVE